YCPVDDAGRFTSEIDGFAGREVFAANSLIVALLKEIGSLVFSEDYRYRYPHCWRCHEPVICRAIPEWFISMDRVGTGKTSLRDAALREVERVSWLPSWGRNRMRNMVAVRTDWCISRQRIWGVPIPVFYCLDCNETIADEAVVEHVAKLFEEETADAWYAREPQDLLSEGFSCPKCDGRSFTKETDVFDVWFDCGSSSISVLEKERGLPWPSDICLEGADQYRGWFNSSLMIGLAAHDRAPYKTVIAHGWPVDDEGKVMHGSVGNAISPTEVVGAWGADILRLWIASTDYHGDMRLSDEILKRQVDAYRKLRNTARFALANIFDFDPDEDRVPDADLWEIDRWAIAATSQLTRNVTEAYRRFDYTAVYHSLYGYATVTLSATYFDILKDRLYTFAPKSLGRRSAQTALNEIVSQLALLLAPILAFTADEIWESIPKQKIASVHLAEFPVEDPSRADDNLIVRWGRLFDVRSAVQKALEEKRGEKLIGASFEATVTLSGDGEMMDLLEQYADQLQDIFIVSGVSLRRTPGGDLAVEVERALGAKCERCWNWSLTVGANVDFPTLDARCVRQIEEQWATAASGAGTIVTELAQVPDLEAADNEEHSARNQLEAFGYDRARQHLEAAMRLDPDRGERLRGEFGFLYPFDQTEGGAARLRWCTSVWRLLSSRNRFPLIELDPEDSSLLDSSSPVIERSANSSNPADGQRENPQNSDPQEKGEQLESAVAKLFRRFFRLGDDVPWKIRRQRSGTQRGFDLSIEWSGKCEAAIEQESRCHIECKNYRDPITMREVADKLLSESTQNPVIDHWILISPRSNPSNELNNFLERQDEEGRFPFQVQVWCPETGIDELFGLEPEVYDCFFFPLGGEPHPRDWDEARRNAVREKWRARLNPPLRLPRGWGEYLRDPALLCIHKETPESMQKPYESYVTMRCRNVAGVLMERPLESYVREWLEAPDKVSVIPAWRVRRWQELFYVSACTAPRVGADDRPQSGLAAAAARSQ
ncbi:MAG TPA: class I tRNA ligase family protein, partial [Blastocatellia bacterium]|nr:class I tRNA ligase family protein [Blastocatellia bacterium]